MSVFINNLDDYIIPSQDCINPLVTNKINNSSSSSSSSSLSLSSSSSSQNNFKKKIQLISDFTISEYEPSLEPNLIKTKLSSSSSSTTITTNNNNNNLKVATVSLNDCLACSGCITSAEAILIQEQSSNKLFEILQQNDKIVVISISPQSVASIASFVGQSQIDTFHRIAYFLKSIGVHYVIDTTSAGDISLIEERREFLKRHNYGKQLKWIRPPTSIAYSSTRTILPNNNINMNTNINIHSDLNTNGQNFQPVSLSELDNLTRNTFNSSQQSIPFTPLPMFCSHCPGWVCFAEKTHPQSLPYISTIKSSQQIIGSIFKHIFPNHSISNIQQEQQEQQEVGKENKTMNWTSQQIFHVSIQPCFDKKLESSRLDFYDENKDVHDVDLVISSTELWLMIEESYHNFINNNNYNYNDNNTTSNIQNSIEYFQSLQLQSLNKIEKLFSSYSIESYQIQSSSTSNGGSGGYLEYLFRYYALKFYQINLYDTELFYQVGRNSDINEIILYSNGSTIPPTNNDNNNNNIQPLLKFAQIYGFRNIQSVILKLKKLKCDYDYIEIMACPSGCLNGGGQIKVKQSTNNDSNNNNDNNNNVMTPTITSSDHINKRIGNISNIYHSNRIFQKPDDTPLVRFIYGQNGDVNDEETYSNEHYFHTQYHAIPKLELIAPLASKW